MNTKHKIVKLPTLKKKLSDLRKQGKKIVFTNGCFDIVHYGHISYLETSKKKDRILVLGLNSDLSVKKLKGPGRPIISQDKRAGLLAAMECVDFVVVFNEETPLKLISSIKPDVLIKGADYKDKVVVGSDVVKENGGKVEFIKFLKNCSSTNIIEEIVNRCKK
ncbi:MAG: D-glycero-beta-D-manno-heptose 1-phosphate adenylyltransferase [Candidatus Omnitrophica bacterium]|nr:D-glycero-beta-D-manno-heptose 1-phosphate adenylyltransferase [Candidatus Omnitrophota bacterium]MBU1997039.1 D-glycero-beta-D-manno-heptose 1-phosphate adenylyltransferase [Candidatus Omnitrophota bacterium]